MSPGIGYCGLDRSRRPLRGDEIRGCWQGAPTPAEVDAAARPAAPASPPRTRGFVPIEALARPEQTTLESQQGQELSLPAPALEPNRGTLFDLDA